MDEEVIAEAAAVGERLKELDMLARDCGLDDCEGVGIAEPRKLRRIDAIALKAFGAAEPTPLGDELGVAMEDAQQHLLVIAKEKHGVDPLPAIGPQPLKHL